MNTCFTCHHPILGTAIVTQGRYYHDTCFRCNSCGIPLQGSYLISNSGEPVCVNCKAKFESTEAGIKCAKCHKGITDTIVSALGQQFHPECFQCHICHHKITGSFSNHQNQPTCTECFVKIQRGLTPSTSHLPSQGLCAGCNKPITDSIVVTALHNKYHKECFKCASCNEQIHSSFQTDLGKIYCPLCFNRDHGKKCQKCHRSITDNEFVVFDDKHYHNSCFRCVICDKSLVGKPLGLTETGGICCNVHVTCKKTSA